MRLAHVIASLNPAEGGPPIVVSRLGAAQQERGHDVHLIANASIEAESRIHDMLGSLPCTPPGSLHLLESTGGLDRFRAGNARRWLEQHIADFDLLHLHGVWDPILAAAAAVADNAGCAWIMTPHGMLDPWCLTQGRLKKRLALATWVGSMLKRARFIHALNEDEHTGMASWTRSTPVETIPNGVFLNEIDPLPSHGTFRATHPELGEAPYVLFLSRLHYKKGLDILIDAFAVIHEQCNAHLVIAGPDDGFATATKQAIDGHQLNEVVHLLGPLYGAVKMAAFVDAECFCLPSRQEGFSMAITEALACGIPVVISEPCHFPEVARVGAGHVVPLDAEQLASALLEVLQPGTQRDRMGQAGRSLVEEHYTWPAIAQRFDSAFASHGIVGSC